VGFFGPHTPDARLKISHALLGNKHAAGNTSRRGKDGLKLSNNPAWRGDEAGNVALHAWVRRHFGKADRCDADPTHFASRYHWSNVDHQYRRVREDWTMLCPKCHFKRDGVTGSSRSEDFKAKVSGGLKKAYLEGRRKVGHSLETRKRMSESRKGRTPWNKGLRKHTTVELFG
jgi:hypothetical protein